MKVHVGETVGCLRRRRRICTPRTIRSRVLGREGFGASQPVDAVRTGDRPSTSSVARTYWDQGSGIGQASIPSPVDASKLLT